jgi:fermentation-respiration switch protein FrsA (DUF1100 family)
LISLAKTLLVAYLTYAVLLFFLQRLVLYPGAKMSPGRSMTDPVPEGISQVWLDHTSGRSEAWWAPAPHAAPGPAIIFGHGNAERIDDWEHEALDLSRRGVGVLLVEYPGYGLSEGKPTRASIGAAFEAAFDWVAARPEVDRDRVVVLGRSLGGGVVTDLAAAKPVRAVILQSTFTSAASLAFRSFGAPGFLLRDAYDNLGNLAQFEGPILLFHGVVDDVIPFSHGERLAAARPDAEFERLQCAHNDCPPDWEHFVARILRFLEENQVL